MGPEWASSTPLRLRDLRGRVVVVRFWTDTCPYCEASLPAMQKLAEEMKEAPVTFVGLYQSKPLGSERHWKGVVAHANADFEAIREAIRRHLRRTPSR